MATFYQHGDQYFRNVPFLSEDPFAFAAYQREIARRWARAFHEPRPDDDAVAAQDRAWAEDMAFASAPAPRPDLQFEAKIQSILALAQPPTSRGTIGRYGPEPRPRGGRFSQHIVNAGKTTLSRQPDQCQSFSRNELRETVNALKRPMRGTEFINAPKDGKGRVQPL